MPWYVHKEIWTPLVVVGIRFFKDVEEGNLWIKVRNKKRRRIRRKR